MGINRDRPDQWKADTAASVAMYNQWYIEYAPKVFGGERANTVVAVENAMRLTGYLHNLTPDLLRENPKILQILRMSTCPPIARDRLVGLSGVRKSLVDNMEDKEKPRATAGRSKRSVRDELELITRTLTRMLDRDIFVWLGEGREPIHIELEKSTAIIADRLCRNISDTIVRNAQEKRQLDAIAAYLKAKGYRENASETKFNEMEAGTFSFRTNVPVRVSNDEEKMIDIPVDILIKPMKAEKQSLPVMIEAKSAGDFANVNKRRKEEAVKMQQLRATYGNTVQYILFLCGYFDSAYLGYEAAEGIDWVWEHRMSDLEMLGI